MDAISHLRIWSAKVTHSAGFPGILEASSPRGKLASKVTQCEPENIEVRYIYITHDTASIFTARPKA